MKKIFAILFISVFVLASCDKMKNKAKDTINKSGEVVGSSATEFVKGVSKGVDKSLKCSLVFSDSLKVKGLDAGDFSITNSGRGEGNNRLLIYLIFEKEFTQTLNAKAFNKEGKEIGRANLTISAKKDEAGYYNFDFDKETVIDAKSKIVID